MVNFFKTFMNILEVVDKTGRTIILTKERWAHITEPSSLHSYMSNFRKEIQETLEKPDKIVKSIYDEAKVSYYKYYKSRKEFLKVISYV